MAKLFLCIVVICFSHCTSASNRLFENSDSLVGNWKWERNSEKGEFNISFIQIGDSLFGSYCAIAQAGDRIDCSRKGEYSFQFIITKSNQVEFKFKTNYSNTYGKAKIIFDNKKLTWEITEKPTGEFYAPLKAVLIKD